MKVVTTSTFQFDVNADGSIDVADFSKTKPNMYQQGTGLVTCP